MVGNNSLDGLLWPRRRAEGRKGGVVHLVNVSALIIPAGMAIVTPFGGAVPQWQYEDESNGTLWMNNPRVDFYSHLDDEQAQHWLVQTMLCLSSVIKDVQHYVPYEYIGKGVDATYLVCNGDMVGKLEAKEHMASLLEEHRRMEYVEGGHCPMIRYAGEVAEVVKRAWEVNRQRLEDGSR